MSSTHSKKMIVFRTSDGETFQVEEAAAQQSQTIKHLIEDGCANGEIPLPNVTAKILAKVNEYLDRHRDDRDPKPSDEDLKAFDAEFFKVDTNTLYDLLMASNYLDIKNLLELGCQTVADMIKGKSPEQIRKMFNIKNDFTPEEEAEVRRENAWVFE